jgi:hypothetical protein
VCPASPALRHRPWILLKPVTHIFHLSRNTCFQCFWALNLYSIPYNMG